MPCSLTTNNRPRTPSLRAFRRRSAVRPAQNAISMPCSYHITREATTRHKSRPVSGEMERGDHADIYAVYSVASHEVRSTSSGRVRCRFANEESQSSRSTIHDMLHGPFLVAWSGATAGCDTMLLPHLATRVCTGRFAATLLSARSAAFPYPESTTLGLGRVSCSY